jgi:RNA polymerase sigma-70 factor, ECF subfamily
VDDVEQALEQLYRSRYARFEAVLATMTRDGEAARDVVQEAFAVALARRRQFRGDGSLEGWVWKIALRLAAGLRPGSRKPVPERLDPAVPEPELDPAIAAAIRTLPPRRRLFVFLRYFADLTYEEIAEACGVRRGTVAAALAQARTELGAVMESESFTGAAIR